VEEEREDWEEDLEEPQGRFDEPEEHAYYADYEVVLGVAVIISTLFRFEVEWNDIKDMDCSVDSVCYLQATPY